MARPPRPDLGCQGVGERQSVLSYRIREIQLAVGRIRTLCTMLFALCRDILEFYRRKSAVKKSVSVN